MCIRDSVGTGAVERNRIGGAKGWGDRQGRRFRAARDGAEAHRARGATLAVSQRGIGAGAGRDLEVGVIVQGERIRVEYDLSLIHI